MVFPHLRPGGICAIEDWDWGAGALGRPGGPWHQYEDCARLIGELQAVARRDPELIAEVGLLAGFAFIRRGRRLGPLALPSPA